MKKLLLFSLILGIGIVGFSQNAPSVSKELRNTPAEASFLPGTDNATNFNNSVNMLKSTGAFAPTEHIIGTTTYDLFSNKFIGNRFFRWEDGTMAAVWMLGLDGTVAMPDRGTGYNYYNGTEWGPQPTVRIEPMKTGWPSNDDWGDGEISVAHNGTAGLEFIQREAKGTGDWTEFNFLGPAGIENDLTWPRLITSGENNDVIHMIANTYVEYMGQTTALLYSRSTDGGATWDPHNVIMEGTGVDHAHIKLIPMHGKCMARCFLSEVRRQW